MDGIEGIVTYAYAPFTAKDGARKRRIIVEEVRFLPGGGYRPVQKLCDADITCPMDAQDTCFVSQSTKVTRF